MTTDAESTQFRRSRRIKDIQSSQTVVYDDDINNSDYQSDGEDSDDYREDPDARPDSGRKRKLRGSKPGTKKSKKSSSVKRVTGKTNTGTFHDLRGEFEEHYLFQSLCDSEVSVTELAVEWVEQYKVNHDLAKKDLVNFILNAVGCFTKIEEHDVNNNESASDTVGEIQTSFNRQKTHEFYFLSKKPEHKHLKKNFTTFISQIVTISEEKGILYENIVLIDEEQPGEDAENANIMEDLLVWLSALSVSSIRALRYVSSLSLFTLETTICKITKKNNSSLENFRHQLEIEQKKKQTARIKKRITAIQKNVSIFAEQSVILENFVQDIVDTAFIHRFKDTDHLIRSEAMISLGEWLDIYPEFFFKVTYLKYLGWVLSDTNTLVRLNVIKTLIKLLRHHNVVTGLRPFLERFKNRIIEIAFHDIDRNVRTSSISLLSEIHKTGFLESEDTNKLISLAFQKQDRKLLSQLSNFLEVVEKEKTNDVVDEFESRIESARKEFPLDLRVVLKASTIIKILCQAREMAAPSLAQPLKLEPSYLATFARLFLGLQEYAVIANTLIPYFLVDISSVDSLDMNLKAAIELSVDEELILLELIHGYLLHLNDKSNEPSAKSRLHKEDASNDTLIHKVITCLPGILSKVENDEAKITIFFKIFGSFEINLFEYSSPDCDAFKSVFSVFLKKFKNNSVEVLKEEYTQLFKSLSYPSSSTIIADVNSKFQTLTSQLIIEFNNYLNASDFDATAPDHGEIYQNYIFKLLLLGLNYNTVSLLDNFKVIKEKLIDFLSEITIAADSKIPSLFQLLTSSSSWKLNSLLTSNEIYDLEKELWYVPELIEEMSDVIIDECDHVPLAVRSKTSSSLIDLLVLLYNFFGTYERSDKHNISNVNRFKEIDLNSFKLSSAIMSSLKYIFLSKEAVLANVLGIELERTENEDVNLNSLTSESLEEGLSDAEIQWELEKDLIIYTKKVLALKKLQLVTDDLVKRIALNVDVLGDLYKTIVEKELQDNDEDKNDHALVQPRSIEDDVARAHGDEDIPDIPMEDS